MPDGLHANGGEPERVQHLPALDGLRAFAIAWVLFSHFWTYPDSTPLVNRFAAAGWGGVDLFFVLSGFLITRILLAAEHRKDYYRRFYLRRARRIIPVYYLVLLIVLVGFSLLGASSSGLARARQDWLWYAAFLSNVLLAQKGWQVFALDVTWSLAIEEQFYLVWPALLRWVKRRRLALLCGGLVVVLPLVRLVLVHTWTTGGPWLDLFTPFRMDNLAAGALLACVEPRLRRFGVVKSLAFWVTLAGVVLLTALGFMTRAGEVAVVVGHSALALLSALVIHAAVAETPWIARIFSLAPLQQFGKVSYGLYLYQGVVMAVVATAFGAAGVEVDTLSANRVLAGTYRVIVLSACTYIVAYLSFRFYESPILRGGSAQRARVMRSGIPA